MENWINKVIKMSDLNENEDVIIYGLEAIIDGIITCLILLILGILYRRIWETICFIGITFYGTSTMGGYHCNSRKRCILFTTVLWFLCIWAETFQITDKLSLLIVTLMIIGVAIVWLIAPISHPNKPLDESTREKNRKNSIIMNISLASIIILFCVMDRRKACVFWSIQMELIISMILGKVVNRYD